MEHITHIELENYLSFRKASCRLSPFTLVVGANNSGKSNLLRAMSDFSAAANEQERAFASRQHHAANLAEHTLVRLRWGEELAQGVDYAPAGNDLSFQESGKWKLRSRIPIYRLSPERIGIPEDDVERQPMIQPDGGGVARVLEALGSGTRASRDIFQRIEREVSRCVPEIEAISLFNPERGKRAVQVEQRGIPKPTPVSELSEGTRLVLAILTLIHQEPPPPLLLLEDIDRAVHPWLFEKLVNFLRGLTRSGRLQVIATCHNPYLLDEFKDEPEAVVIVEKVDGASVLSNMDDRIAALLADGELEMPLGEVWFRGFAGGVPQMKLPEMLRVAEA